MDHAQRIRKQYLFLIEKLDVKYLLSHLWSTDVISRVEKESIEAAETSTRQVQILLSLVAMKPADVFDLFLDALNLTGQSHVSNVLGDKSKSGKMPERTN